MNRRDFRVVMLYEFKLRHSAMEAARNMADVFGLESPSERTVRYWFEKFSHGDFNIEDKPGRGRKMSLDEQDLRTAVESKPEVSVRAIAEDLGVHHATVARHLSAIGMVKKKQKWIPHELTDEQRLTRFTVCSNLLIRLNSDPFLNRLITVDEKWVLYDNRKRGYVWVDKSSPPSGFPKPDLHPKKTMLTVWWCRKGVIHHSFEPSGHSVTSESYCRDLDIMFEKLRLLWPAVVNRGGPILLQDNAPPHSSRLTRLKLSQLGIEVLPHPPYSPDLSPTDYHLFRALDAYLRQQQFANFDDLEVALLKFFDSCNLDFYSKGILALQKRWQQCVESNGSYFD